MLLSMERREELNRLGGYATAALTDELDQAYETIRSHSQAEHHDDGTHAAVTADSVTVNGDCAIEGGVFYRGTGIRTPEVLTHNVNNYNPTETGHVRGVHTLRIRVDASRNITGLVAGTAGQKIQLFNISTTVGLDAVLVHQGAASLAPNRFIGNNLGNVTLTPGRGLHLWYDGASEAWRIMV